MSDDSSLEFNDYVRERLKDYRVGIYQLNEAGKQLVYDANAGLGEDYAEDHDFRITGLHSRDIAEKIKLLPPREFGTCLDVCCGSGFLTLNLMHSGTFHKCVSIDINEKALEYLGKKLRRYNISNVEPSCQNIMQTDFPDNSFDCILGNSFLHHIPDNPAFLREMHRILKPGGTICFTHEPSVSAVALENYLFTKIKRLKRRNGEMKTHDLPLTDIWQYSEKPLRQVLSGAGFASIRIEARGRVATIIGTFLERTWSRVFGKMPPTPVFYIRKLLLSLEGNKAKNPDDYSSFTICARK